MVPQNLHFNETDHPKAAIKQDRSLNISVTNIDLAAISFIFKILTVSSTGNCLEGVEKQLQ